MASRLATVELADAVGHGGDQRHGSLRFNGRKQELPAIDALEAQVIDPSNEQSATAVLDKISGAVLIGARQRQARSPAPRRRSWSSCWSTEAGPRHRRRRDEHAARHVARRPAANEAFVAGTGDALRTWRQP